MPMAQLGATASGMAAKGVRDHRQRLQDRNSPVPTGQRFAEMASRIAAAEAEIAAHRHELAAYRTELASLRALLLERAVS